MNALVRPAAFLLSALLLTGCAFAPIRNKLLSQYQPDGGYRLSNVPPSDGNSDSLYVVLTFSGGGTRAAAFSYGVLEKLRDTEISWEGRRRALLDEVDLISSVSGGSITAAYYGLFRERIFQDYVDDVLYRDIQKNLIRRLFAVSNYAKLWSPFYGRTDLMAETFNREIYHYRKFGDLTAINKRPFILINSTDMTLGNRFAFTQEYFDLLNSDLSSYPVGHAVAASAAFPGLLTPMTLRNYPNPHEYELPEWAVQALEEAEPGSFSYELAQGLESYVGPERPFIHLIDGGVSDNLGVLPVIMMLRGIGVRDGFYDALHSGAIKKMVIIVVNAERELEGTWDQQPKIVRIFNVINAVSYIPIGNFSLAQMEYLQMTLDRLVLEQRIQRQLEQSAGPPAPEVDLPDIAGVDADFHLVQVSFDRLGDASRRERLNAIPTRFGLPQEEVDQLRKAASDILDNEREFKRLLAELAEGQ